MANSRAKKQGIASHLRRLALLHGYEARMNRGEKIALMPQKPVLRTLPVVLKVMDEAEQHARGGKKKMSCLGCSGCGGRCNKKLLLPAAAALNGYMRRSGKSLGDLGFDFSDFADNFSKLATGVASNITAIKSGIGAGQDTGKKVNPPAAAPAPAKSSLPAWLLPAGAAAGGVGLVLALSRR